MAIPKVYLDTCVVSGIAKEDLTSPEQGAVFSLLRLYKAGRIDLVTSEVAEREIGRVPEAFRSRHESVYLLLKDVPVARAEWTDSGLALTGVGGGRRENPLYSSLKALLPGELDAQHVFQTNDQHGIIAALPTECVRLLGLS